MTSSIIASIDSILMAAPAWGEMKGYKYLVPFCRLRLGLWSLKVFVLCLRMRGNDLLLGSSSSESPFSRIEDAIGSILKHVQSDSKNDEKYWESISRALQGIHYLVKETDEWYTVMSNHTGLSSSLTADEIAVITDSILKIKDDLQRGLISIGRSGEAMKAFGVQVTIWKNFLLFTVQTSIEKQQLENLLIHFEVVAINVAQAFINAGYESNHNDFLAKMELQYSLLAPKVNIFYPQVSSAYTQALGSSRLSRRLYAPTEDVNDDTMIKLMNFLDSLISVFWDVLLPDSFELDCMKDQLQMLYEGLRLSRTILKQQPKNFDNKILVQIGVFVCEVGILICSSHQKINAAIDPCLPDLLDRIKVIQAEAEKKNPRTLAFIFPVTKELGYVDSMFENLLELTSHNGQAIAEILPQTMQEELVFLRSFLEKPMDLLNEQQELQALRNRALTVAYKVQFLIDRLVFGSTSNSFSNLFDPIMEDIIGIKIEAKKISFGDRKDIKVQKMIGISSDQPPQSIPSLANGVFGFHNEATSIVNRLTRAISKQLHTIVISGMAGVGKTTLAFKVYNDPSIMRHFGVRAWCSISQVLDKKKVLVELLNQIHQGEYLEMSENDLMEKLYRTLKRKRYLIFLDDVWNIEVWNSLRGSFPDDSTESRILLTSQYSNIAPPEICYKAELLPLNFQDSITLLGMKLFGGEGWPSTLKELGKQIAERCKGLPLTIVIVAGLLAKMKQESWKDILDGIGSGIDSSTEVTEQCMKTLELSYKYLPDYLKPCLLYFGVFLEDEEVSVKRLILLWIAEGFIKKAESKRMEDVAEEYITDLFERSLLIVAKHRTIGGAKTCRVHDVIHDFCVRRAKQESFFHLLQGRDLLLNFNEPCYMQRLIIHSELADFKEWKLFCPRARSLLFFSPPKLIYTEDSYFITLKFKLLNVLDIKHGHFGSWLPSEIGLLIRLKYLSIRGFIEGKIPFSIGNLFNLETLILYCSNPFHHTRLPSSIFNLKKLKYLQIGKPNGAYLEDLQNSSGLSGLETFSWVVIYHDDHVEELMRKFPNIRRLKLQIRLYAFGLRTILGELESLAIDGLKSSSTRDGSSVKLEEEDLMAFRWECGLSAKLRKLKLMHIKLSGREISIMGKLPTLQVLKLEGVAFSDNTLEMEEGEFLELRFFKLCSKYIVKWTAYDELPNLQRLVLQWCERLEEIPTFLESIPTLEEIDVFNCSHEVESSVEHIQNEQIEFGNHIKIHIQSMTFSENNSSESA